jgi:hypothetical protein
MFGNSMNQAPAPKEGHQNNQAPDTLLREMFKDLSLDQLVNNTDTFQESNVKQQAPSTPTDNLSTVVLDSSEIMFGGKPLERRESDVSKIVVDQNTENPSDSFAKVQVSIQNSPTDQEGVIFLHKTAKALTGYIARILKANEVILGSTGTKYSNKDIAADIILYLDKENPDRKKRTVNITNNTFYLQANTLLLEKIKEKLLGANKGKAWETILSEIDKSLKI